MFEIINLNRLKIDLQKKNNLNLKELKLIINKKIKKVILIIGPCSLNNIKEFLEYYKKIIINEKNILIILRLYYEKPRSNIGWKGYIYDPYIDNSYCLIDSVYILRKLLVKLNFKQIKIAVECLNFYLINYFLDLISWICIGARTVQSQLHREFCSSLKCIVGIKNDISGDQNSMIDTFKSINNKHCYLNFFENSSLIFSKGNKFCQFVLRGGKIPNFNYSYIKTIKNSIIVDCSHSNSMKNAINQIYVFENVINQYYYYKNNINGIMLESYLNYGNQNILNKFKYISVTDSCIDIKITNFLIKKLNDISRY